MDSNVFSRIKNIKYVELNSLLEWLDKEDRELQQSEDENMQWELGYEACLLKLKQALTEDK